ncbi:MAG: hypothetical protein ABIJ09_25540 [Pseudomonadota bacterium]
MKTLHGIALASFSLAVMSLVGCDSASLDPASGEDPSLRAALSRTPEELELADLPGRRAVAERMLRTARTQVESQEREQLEAAATAGVIGAVGVVDGERDARGVDPILVAAVQGGDDAIQVEATGTIDFFTPEHLTAEALDPRLRIDVGFLHESSEALGGRSEAQTVEALSGFLGSLGQQAAPTVTSWTVMRRPGLRAALVLLVDEGILEVNPAFLYYISAISRPVSVAVAVPATAGGPDSKPPADDWQIFLRWLESADPSSWTNLGTGESQSYDSGYYEPTPTPNPFLLCPCCYCSSLGLGVEGPARGFAAILGALLPLGALILIRRRG